MNLVTATALITSVWLFESCAIAYPNLNDTSFRIVGGQAVSIEAYPYQVAVTNLETSGLCGGSILDADTILTAAHCIKSTSPSSYAILAGSTYRSVDTALTQRRSPARVVPHPNFNPGTMDNDIAIIKLETPLSFNKAIAPIDLPPAGFIPKIGDRATASGWGTTRENGQASDGLRAVVLALVWHKKCEEVHGPDVTTRQFCATAEGKDTCQGDSGGPLALPSPTTGDRMVIGITSYGEGCARPGSPGVYTRVSAYRPWIQSAGGPPAR